MKVGSGTVWASLSTGRDTGNAGLSNNFLILCARTTERILQYKMITENNKATMLTTKKDWSTSKSSEVEKESELEEEEEDWLGAEVATLVLLVGPWYP